VDEMKVVKDEGGKVVEYRYKLDRPLKFQFVPLKFGEQSVTVAVPGSVTEIRFDGPPELQTFVYPQDVGSVSSVPFVQGDVVLIPAFPESPTAPGAPLPFKR
jgi:hypothetical protein